MRILSDAVKWFMYITTGILIVVAINVAVVGEQTISVNTLWNILLSGFLTTVVTMLLYPREENRKSTVFIKCFLHYLALCIVMVICGKWFGWINLNLAGILLMAVSVAVVYGLAFLSYYIVDVRQADEINRRLKEKYSDEE